MEVKYSQVTVGSKFSHPLYGICQKAQGGYLTPGHEFQLDLGDNEMVGVVEDQQPMSWTGAQQTINVIQQQGISGRKGGFWFRFVVWLIIGLLSSFVINIIVAICQVLVGSTPFQ